MHEEYSPQEMRLANEIAETLKDRDSITLHLQYAKRYQEDYLRRVLHKVMAIDEIKIRKTRAALYTFLINQGNRHGNPRH